MYHVPERGKQYFVHNFHKVRHIIIILGFEFKVLLCT